MSFGQITAKLGGKERILKFNVNATYEFCKLHSCTHEESIEILNDPVRGVSAYRDMIYCALRSADLQAGNVIDYNQYDVGDWISELTQDELERIVTGYQDGTIKDKETSKKKR
jgi:hypothetical protein